MGRPRTIPTPTAFDARVDAYVDTCRKNHEPVLLTGLILALGLCSKPAFYEYEKREGFQNSVKRARLLVENAYEAALHKGNPAGPIFALKNFGWSDRLDVVSSDGSMSPVPAVDLSHLSADELLRLTHAALVAPEDSRNGC